MALEPDQENFELLSMNAEPYKERVVALRNALWWKSSALKIARAAGDNSHSMLECQEGEAPYCQGLTPFELMERYAIPQADIFKIDIEGSEEILFRQENLEWLSRCRVVVVDVHSDEAGRAVGAAARRFGYIVRRHRELLVLRRSGEL